MQEKLEGDGQWRVWHQGGETTPGSSFEQACFVARRLLRQAGIERVTLFAKGGETFYMMRGREGDGENLE